MTGFSDFFADKILNEMFRDEAAATLPASIFVALYTAMPTNGHTGQTEVTGGSYARASIATTNAAWNAPATNATTNRRITNVAAVTFTTPTANWGTVVGFGLYLTLAGTVATDFLGSGAFSPTKVINSGDPVQFNAGELAVDITRPSA